MQNNKTHNSLQNSLQDNSFTVKNRTISEVSALIGVPQYVLRFWESKFSNIIKPKKNKNRRYYNEEEILVLNKIKYMLYNEGYTIKGLQNILSSSPPEAAIEDREFAKNLRKKNDELNYKESDMVQNTENTELLETLSKESAKPNRAIQTNLASLVKAASNEIIKNHTQLAADKQKLQTILTNLTHLRNKLADMINDKEQ